MDGSGRVWYTSRVRSDSLANTSLCLWITGFVGDMSGGFSLNVRVLERGSRLRSVIS